MTRENDYIEIPLHGRKFSGLVAIVDREDAELVGQAAWRAVVVQTKEALATKRRILRYVSARRRDGVYPEFPRYLYLHRLVMGVTDPRIHVDHINHDGLDCRKSNLRLVTHQQNHFNRRPNSGSTSKFKGVHWRKNEQKWGAVICLNNSRINLGYFDSEIEAAIAYDNAAEELFGEFAYLNLPLRKVS